MRINRKMLIGGISSAIALVLIAGGLVLLTRNGKTVAKPTAERHSQLPSRKSRKVLRSPFTGERIARLGPELIFKIDNVVQARPPSGLTKADIVYLLPVDAGLSRIFAVFSSHIPRVVGPVRSARAEDIRLLRQFGRPAFAFSGAQPRLLPVVEHSRIIDLYDGIVGGYYRDNSRIAPYNLYALPRRLLAEAKGRESKARDIGFRFGKAPRGGRPTKWYTVTYPEASFTFRWSPSQHRWLSFMDGKPAYSAGGKRLGARTVVIQSVVVGRSHFRELGIKPPYANTVGSGRAVVLRDGAAFVVHWSRPRAGRGTAFTLPDGHRMRFARGQVWVVFRYGPGSSR
ncbi:MAG TPA: DUF3048 domain-containing protein [Streptosporangiaceae bacterium]|nr:DUF3048 domain-containing protein [Streptosporangiaceae bacterium]